MDKLTAETMPWEHYDSLDIDESAAFLEEHPEARQLLYARDMERMAARRNGEAHAEVNPGVSVE